MRSVQARSGTVRQGHSPLVFYDSFAGGTELANEQTGVTGDYDPATQRQPKQSGPAPPTQYNHQNHYARPTTYLTPQSPMYSAHSEYSQYSSGSASAGDSLEHDERARYELDRERERLEVEARMRDMSLQKAETGHATDASEQGEDGGNIMHTVVLPVLDSVSIDDVMIACDVLCRSLHNAD